MSKHEKSLPLAHQSKRLCPPVVLNRSPTNSQRGCQVEERCRGRRKEDKDTHAVCEVDLTGTCQLLTRWAVKHGRKPEEKFRA